MSTDHRRARTWILTLAAAGGLAVGAAGIAAAADSGSSSTPAAVGTATDPGTGTQTPPQDPAQMTQGPGETLLTGDPADQVQAAALEAVPGSTIIRVETDSAGSPYEAHVRKADGTEVTVKVDADFTVTDTEQGFGGGPGGQAPQRDGASTTDGAGV